MALRQLKKCLGPLWFTLQYPQEANLQALTSFSPKHKTQKVQEGNLPREAWAPPMAPNSLFPTQKVEQFRQQGSWISASPGLKLSTGWSPHSGKSHKPCNGLGEAPGPGLPSLHHSALLSPFGLWPPPCPAGIPLPPGHLPPSDAHVCVTD